jgi:ribosomal protein S18 acetylase RimI-like enzyme
MTHPAPNSQIVLVPAQNNDLPVLIPFIRQFYQHFNYPFHEAQKSDVLKNFIRNGSLGRLMLINHHDTTIGYVLIAFSFSLEFNGPIAFIDELFIEPAARQKGTGSHVLAQVESFCTGLGIQALRLETESSNERATALYIRSGYHDHQRHLLTKVLKKNASGT